MDHFGSVGSDRAPLPGEKELAPSAPRSHRRCIRVERKPVTPAGREVQIAALDAFEGSVTQLRAHIANRDAAAIHAWLARAADWRREVDA